MTYATVLLPLDAHPGLDLRIDFAVRLARKFESHLVGVAAAERSMFALCVATGFSGTPQLAQAVEDSRAEALARGRQFGDRADVQQLKSSELIVDDRDKYTAVVRRSTCSDLLVLAQADPAWPDYAQARDRLEQIVLHSAAPTLVLPFSGQFAEIGSNVLIAWNGSPESAHAVVAALPLLQRARKVHLIQCDSPLDLERGDDPAMLELPREWLGRHGVRLDAWIEATGTDVGNAVLLRATDVGADMLVMGAWGHSRWTERILGGATRTILSSMTVPVLMAH